MQKENKKKILNIHDYPPTEGGGVEVTTFETSKKLVEMGFDVTIATSRFSSETLTTKEQAEEKDGVKIVLLSTVNQLAEMIDKTDIVHIHFTFSFRPASMLGLKLCVEKNKPCIFTLETVYDHIPFSAIFTDSILEKDRKLTELVNHLGAKTVYLSGPSENVTETLNRLGIYKDVKVVRNGCTTLQKVTKDKINVPKVNITYVGELSFLKGINYLIDAVRLVRKQGNPITARLIGGGSDELEMKRLVAYHGLSEVITFPGYIKNCLVPSYLAKTDFYVHPSLTESWGNAVIEALSMGIPVICTKVGGLTEATNQGKFASLVSPADARDLAKKINQALKPENFALEKQKAKIAQKYIQKNYTFKNQAKVLAEFYEEILATK